MVFNLLLCYVYLLDTLYYAAHLKFSKSDIKELLESECWAKCAVNMIYDTHKQNDLATSIDREHYIYHGYKNWEGI